MASRPTSSQTDKLDDLEKQDDSRSASINTTPRRSADGDVEKHAAPLDPAADEKQAFLVKWDAGEKTNPRNWSTGYKAFITFELGMLALSASLGSSIIAPAEPAISAYLGVTQEVTVLSISLYVLGFAFGYVHPAAALQERSC